MERIRQTFFDPLAASKTRIRDILQGLPVGSAHPFSPEQILLCRTENGIEEIDISSYPEEFFFNAADLGEMGETLLRRVSSFPFHLSVFHSFRILQAPASTFKIPIVSGKIAILAVSESKPTCSNFCFADASCNTCCWKARNTFAGIAHSAGIIEGDNLLEYIIIDKDTLTDKEICVFISGFDRTPITKFLGTNPALFVADYVDKVLYIIPVPLDAATIGDATICCPLVIKRDGDSLICSILPMAATDTGIMCNADRLVSPCFPEAIKRADFTMINPIPPAAIQAPIDHSVMEDIGLGVESLHEIIAKDNIVFTTTSATLPSFVDLENTQVIRFGTGLEFYLPGQELTTETQASSVVLPCIFGSRLQGPVLLATGTVALNVPFRNERALRDYYDRCKNIVVIVDERMTDNTRNIASSYRINALFIVQLSPQSEPKNSDDVLSLLDSANINAVTALAGPQSLVVIQISDKYYFYRGIANRAHLNTSGLAFGSDVTSIIESVGMDSVLNPGIKRVVDLAADNTIILPASGRLVKPKDLLKEFEELPVEELPVEEIQAMDDDISGVVPQLQILMDHRSLQELSKAFISALSAKANNAIAPLRNSYLEFLNQEYKIGDLELAKKKNILLGRLRKSTKEMQEALKPAISNLANIVSAQTSSRRTHDLKLLRRQAEIQGSVEASKSMTFDKLAGYLETYAEDMGVMLVNIETEPLSRLLHNLKDANATIDASSACELDSRILYLDGFDAGIIIEQSQATHCGPLQSHAGPSRPILALPCLSQSKGNYGSMLAWVCWDEFVNLESPYTVRWIEKCHEPHIAALRIIMRDTVSRGVMSIPHNFHPRSPKTGRLMSALLMATMTKLAAMRTPTPVVLDKAEDTIMRLMRGLFGNLLTLAASEVQNLSLVWQLFRRNPQYDVPTTDADWIWYETAVTLYPYTGWPLKKFHKNLEKLLDKVIVRVVTLNENRDEIKRKHADDMIKYGKLRNIQLGHSRTIITIFMRMLTTEDIDIATVAARLLKHLPQKLEKPTESYAQMIHYLEHLASGGRRRVNDDLVVASVYTKRSAAFSELKEKVLSSHPNRNPAAAKKLCQELMDEHGRIAALWHIEPESLKFSNMKAYKELLEADFGDGMDQQTKAKSHRLISKIRGDAEIHRVPWRVGKGSAYGDDLEPLDEDFLRYVLTGENPESVAATDSDGKSTTLTTTTIAEQEAKDGCLQFNSLMKSEFIITMQQNLSPEDVCRIAKVPVSAMRVFIKALNPDFIWEDLGENFQMVILGLLNNRPNRAESRPVKRLFGLKSGKTL